MAGVTVRKKFPEVLFGVCTHPAAAAATGAVLQDPATTL
jgi:hypothetical protein